MKKATKTLFKDTDFKLVTEFIKPDKKKRITLGAACVMEAFNIYLNKFGQILLDPVCAVSASEAWLHENKAAMALFEQGIQEPAASKVHGLGSRSKTKPKKRNEIASSGKFFGSSSRGKSYTS
ncbi:MAG: hypothetical protein ACOYK6_07580 [Chthoniobacterales bacterium]